MTARRSFTVVAHDPAVRDRDEQVLVTRVVVPGEELDRGPRGHRAAVIDYDATQRKLYAPHPASNGDDPYTLPAPKTDEEKSDRRARVEAMLNDPRFHAQNVYAIVMRTLARFEYALGRRVGWGFDGQQIKIAPHAFELPNAFYSKQDQALLFGYFRGADGWVFTCLAHDVVVHETTHAILDGLRERYVDLSHPDQAAFHEGFADVVALLSVYSLPDVVSKLLPGDASSASIAIESLKRESLRQSVLLGLATQMGQELAGVRGDALRRSVTITPDRKLATDPEYLEPHRRGELLVAAIMNTFLDAWLGRIEGLGQTSPGQRSRERVIEEAASAADSLLTIVIRALDYTPPVDVRFDDFLSAVLTSDYENRPDDSKYEFRECLVHWFGEYGFAPASKNNEGRWDAPKDADQLVYGRTHFESLRTDETEVFRFLWENRAHLGLSDDAYTRVMSVRPCLRVVQDGFTVRETVAEYKQVIHVLARHLRDPVEAPEGMPPDLEVALHGGGTLIFDEHGRLKYHVSQRPESARQNERLKLLWNAGLIKEHQRVTRKATAFANLHLTRALQQHGDQPEEF